MSTTNIVVDQFKTTEYEVFVPNVKFQSNNVCFNSSIEDYPEELKICFSKDSNVVNKKSTSKPKVVDKDIYTKTVFEKSLKSGSKKVAKYFSEKIVQGGYDKEVPTISTKVVKELFVPDIDVQKYKKLKTKSMSFGVVIKEIANEEAQQNKKLKATGVLKCFKKFRAQTVEEPYAKASSIPNTFEADNDSKYT
ncbi:unnamed protein product [Lactuca virosa]|uniref:Uncharacterized protein n=1 Tax=Lactuca virosa TaxID=75947 RepID=A0AAU9PVR4_9ASTR|nr:unnamed protein product [Lactuca virosa]